MIVLGIDPGLAATGYGVVERRGSRLSRSTAASSRPRRACGSRSASAQLHDALSGLLREHEPVAMALESLYFGANARTAFAVGQARGVAMLCAGQRGVACFSYTPQQVKGAVCGTGSAPKDQVARMVAALLALAIRAVLRSRLRRARRRDLPRQPRPARPRDRGARRVIALVRGEVAERGAEHVTLLCGGVGYRLAVSAQTLAEMPAVGAEATLHAHLIVRDDALVLVGFATPAERDLFLMLLGVQAVGPKLALAVLGAGPLSTVLGAIASGDAQFFQGVSGVGRRTAERIIVELREKVGAEIGEQIVRAARRGDARCRASSRATGCSSWALRRTRPSACWPARRARPPRSCWPPRCARRDSGPTRDERARAHPDALPRPRGRVRG